MSEKRLRLTDEEINVIAYEGFMTGRVYHSMGEQEPPAEINEKLKRNVRLALASYRRQVRSQRRAERRTTS